MVLVRYSNQHEERTTIAVYIPLHARSLMEEPVRLYHSGLTLLIWTWCVLERTCGDSPPACGLGKP